MVPARANSLDFHTIRKHFDRLLSVHIGRVGYAELAVLVEASGEDLARLSQEKGVEFTGRYLLQALTVEVWLIILWCLNSIRYLIPVKDFTMLSIVVPVLAKLESSVLAETVSFAFVINKQLVLET